MNPAPAREQVRSILASAVNAPSGDNSQPWRFRFEGDDLLIFNVPDADGTLYNYRQRGSYLAHGALVENIELLAREKGWEARVTPFPQLPDCTARVIFTPGTQSSSPLASAVARRTTNRKPYERRVLDAEHKDAIQDAAGCVPDTELRIVEDETQIAALAKAVSTNERLLMENRTLHDFLFGIIRWNAEEERTKPGLYLKTMELPPPVQVLFRFVFRHWNAVKALNHIGLSKMIPKQSGAGYAASSAFGAIILTDSADAQYLAAGRAFERAWLAATSCGVSIQPTTALPYLLQRVEAGAAEAFTPEQQALIRDANAVIAKTFELDSSEHIAMLFRMGYGKPPTATSAKLPPVFID